MANIADGSLGANARHVGTGLYSQALHAQNQRAADQTYPHAGAVAAGRAPRAGLFVNAIGGLVSLGLIVGVVIWGYQLLARDVSGVPVVRSLDGPMRVAPKDPGGTQADHQGLAVNNVAAIGTAAGASDRLTLAPQPTGLSDEDQPIAELTPAAMTAPADPKPSRTPAHTPADPTIEELLMGGADLAATPDAVTEAAAQAPVTTGSADADIAALTEELTAGVAELSALTPQVVEPAPQLASAAPPDIQGGVAISKRPLLRPAALSTAPVAPAPVAAPASLDVDPALLVPGTRLVQLGAFDSADIASAEWDRLNSRFADFLDGKSRVIQEATKAGRTFYRLRAHGFADLADARRFCSALVAEKAACIPVLIR